MKALKARTPAAILITSSGRAADHADVRDGLGLPANGKARPVVAARRALEDIREAFEMTKRRDRWGTMVPTAR
ncbi:hypothetical protein [Sinosporangium album]|uniref:hypothetical protein n=1 Tax=Sinosporangium album TaxID=504805 RepID=UPI00159F8E74|nr:hypothetical protein [Sinosporangium album]